MFKNLFVFALLLLSVLSLPAQASFYKDDAIAVTNRSSGDLSLINARTLAEQRVSLSQQGETVEPMYVNHWRGGRHANGNRIFVGDRANHRMMVLDDQSFKVIKTIPVGKGVFHQWVQPNGNQLWVVGDIDNTVSVINPLTLQEIKRIHIPAALTEQGGIPHDVFVTNFYAYVTVVNLPEGSRVLRYNVWDFEISAEANAGGDAHLFAKGGRLYVPSQDDSMLRTFNLFTMQLENALHIPSAHGITSNRATGDIFVTNLAGGGQDAVFSITRNGKRVLDTENTSFTVPHNVVLDEKARQLFVTHSGDNSSVSVLRVNRKGKMKNAGSVNVGQNPFGIGFVKNVLPRY